MAEGRTNWSSLMVFALLFVLSHHVQAHEISKNIYIVYLGDTQYEDPMLTKKSHYDLLSNFLRSKQAARNSMVYSYKHGFSGFAARLPESQGEEIAELPGVIKVFRNRVHKLHTTRSWDYLELNYHDSDDISSKTNMGAYIIIGLIDSGIWPESESFNNDGMGPIPSKWKGICQEGERFNSSNCNRKLIGARWWRKGISQDPEGKGFLSPRDAGGHGTHTASTAAGRLVTGANYNGLAAGIARGGAPLARIAMYKVCWADIGCTDAEMVKAFDKAIHDGVDVISISIGSTLPLPPYIDESDTLSIGAYHATVRGIPVVASGGNEGPFSWTISNTAPWLITVAASTIDRVFPTSITLGNNNTFLGQSINSLTFGEQFHDLVNWESIAATATNHTFSRGRCNGKMLNSTLAAGKFVFCFSRVKDPEIDEASEDVSEAPGYGLIIAQPRDSLLVSCILIPCVKVDYKVGTDILDYIRNTRYPIVKLGNPKTTIGKVVSPRVAEFSSRGPSSLSPAVLKQPDITAPGVAILAAVPPYKSETGFRFKDGTSMACPHVAGIVALIKSLHPDWSPAAIKSALVTTASQTGTDGQKIIEEGATRKPADPFDIGGGHVDPSKASDPGLIYDMRNHDYAQFLCSMGYTDAAIKNISKRETPCKKKSRRPAGLDLNLPSISIPNLQRTVTVIRTVTNVGPTNSVYEAVVHSPHGVKMTVKPKKLIFNSTVKTLRFEVNFSSNKTVHEDYTFGSLSWRDGKHSVRIPVAVKHIMFDSYSDM